MIYSIQRRFLKINGIMRLEGILFTTFEKHRQLPASGGKERFLGHFVFIKVRIFVKNSGSKPKRFVYLLPKIGRFNISWVS